MNLFLDFLFYSSDLFIYSCVNIILFIAAAFMTVLIILNMMVSCLRMWAFETKGRDLDQTLPTL